MPIRYAQAVLDERAVGWVSDAGIAEAPFTAFVRDPAHTVTGRLIVRRVKDKNTQDPLFPVWRYHCTPTAA
jgi:hypothetical protein